LERVKLGEVQVEIFTFMLALDARVLEASLKLLQEQARQVPEARYLLLLASVLRLQAVLSASSLPTPVI
jgi:hypothetical protein